MSSSGAQPGPAAPGPEDELGWSLHRVATAFRQTAVDDLPGGPRGHQVLVAVHAGPPSSQLPGDLDADGSARLRRLLARVAHAGDQVESCLTSKQVRRVVAG